MSTSAQVGSWIIVTFVLAASFYFYNNHKFLTYVYTADSFDEFSLTIPPSAVSSMMENECKWPILRDIHEGMRTSIPRFRDIRCDRFMEPFVYLDEYGFLEVSEPIIGDLMVKPSISCYYHPLLINTIGKVIIGEAKKIKFNEPMEVRHNQIVVECYRDSPPKNVLFRKAYVNIPLYIGPEEESKFVKSDPDQPSLAMLVFDSVSLNHFKRSMPKTTKFLIDNDFFVFNMYNEITDDSNANLLSIVRGGDSRNEDGAFLWDIMRDRQCLTYLSEEIGDFSSLLGNMSLDAEHDLRPFYSYNKRISEGHCLPDGHVASYEYLENWKNALLRVKERCHFSMHYIRALTNVHHDYLSLMDTEVKESLELLKVNGLFEDTAFVLLSSRGNPPKVEDELFTARVEERSPLFAIKLPEKFLRKNPDQNVAMGYNVNRLVTTRDIGMTLMDIANVSFAASPAKERNDDQRITAEEEALAGASLLRHIHSNWRSCDDAGIPPQLCLCMDKKIFQSDDYTNDTEEFEQMFEYARSKILLNDCVEKVEQTPALRKVFVFSLNAMVQQGVRQEQDWHRARTYYRDLGMKYLEIAVRVFPFRKSTDKFQKRFTARMMFRSTVDGGLEPVGTPVIRAINHDCFIYEVSKYCEMCHYNRLYT